MLRAIASLPSSPRGRVIIVTLAVAVVAVALAIATPPSRSSRTTRTVGLVGGRSDQAMPAPTIGLDQAGGGGVGGSPGAPDAQKAVGPSTGTAEVGSPNAAGALGSTDVAVPNVGNNGPVTLDEKIARTAAMEVRVKRGTFNDAWQRATQVATAVGGSVTSSSTTDIGTAARSGTMTLRVPSDHFQRALDGLSGVGKVRSLATGSQDATQEYVDASSRLRHDRAVEARLLTLLSRANTVSEALAVQNRLDAVQSQIEVETGRIQYLTNITSFSTIDVTIAENGRQLVRPPHKAHSSALGSALRVAADRFTANIARGIVWLGGALPLLLLAAAVVLGVRFALGRRNRTAG